MAGEDRTFSIGAFDREFEKIQSDLQGISEGIDKRLSSPIASKTRSSITGIEENKAISNYDFNELLTCSDEEFDDKTNSMKSVDIDMVIIIFEQQIQMIRELNTELGTANLSQLRERLTKCFMKKTELVRRQSKPLIVEHSFVKDSSVSNDNGSEDFTALEDISSLSFAELQALLYYNGVEYDENSNKEALVTLVRSEILDIDDGAIDDWEPPGDNEILWKSPTSKSEIESWKYETESSKVANQAGDKEFHLLENRDAETPTNKVHENDTRIPEIGSLGPKTIAEAEGSGSEPALGSLNLTTRQADSDIPFKERLSDASALKEVVTMASGLPKDATEGSGNCPTKKEEGTVVDWDPTPLLQDLYLAIKRPEPVNFDKDMTGISNEEQNCKIEGYLEKLPVNQTKATFLKGWKKRYFRISQGKIHYFEDHLAAAPLGSILLTGSDLKCIGEKVIQIIAQNTGNLITIRCSSSNETNDWYRMIKRESAISTPVTPPVKVSSQLDNPTSNFIIIDLGASTIRGGFAGEEKPRVVFPAVYAVNTEGKGGRKFTESGLPDPSMCKCGYDALKPEIRKNSKLIFPLRPTLKVDKFAVKSRYIPGLIDRVLKQLHATPENSTIILSCQRHFGEKDKEIIFDHLFGHLGVSAVFAQQQALLSLYSYKDTTGIVVDIGDHIDVFPVVEDVIIESGSSSIPQGGQLVTENLARLLSEGGYRFFSEVESYIVRYLKEKTSFVSLDYEKELEVMTTNQNVDVKKYNLPGKQSTITVSSERFRCAEGLFDPNKWGKDYEGVHKLIEKAIKQSGIDQRKEMCRKIFLSGGTTMIEGFQERLQKEIKLLMPETVNVTVHAAENRANAAFMGASVIAEQPTFGRNLINKEDWLDHGSDIFSRMVQN